MTLHSDCLARGRAIICFLLSALLFGAVRGGFNRGRPLGNGPRWTMIPYLLPLISKHRFSAFFLFSDRGPLSDLASVPHLRETR